MASFLDNFDLNMIQAAARDVALQLEGPYKWYIIAIAVILITAILTRVIFKTFKWFLLIILFAILGGGLFLFLSYFASEIGARL